MSGHSDDSSNSILKIALNLTVACFVSGLIISGVYALTADAAAEKVILLRNEAMRVLVADADDFTPWEENEQIFIAEKAGEAIAFIVPSEQPGYEGVMQVLVAIATDGTVIDYTVTAHKETPGLGDKVNTDNFRSQFAGKSHDDLIVVKDPTKTENIIALTGATISSTAVTNAVKKALVEAEHLIGGK
jgi:electron transport complex protein RnfG